MYMHMQRDKKYYAARIIMMIVSLAWVVSSLLCWAKVDGRTLGIIAALQYGIPLWHLIVPLFALCCLILVIIEPEGLYWLILWAALPGFVLTAFVGVSWNRYPGVELTFITQIGMFVWWIYFMAGGYLCRQEPVSLDALLAPLAHAGRMKHLRSLAGMARDRGWQMQGPFMSRGDISAITNVFLVDGNYRGHAIKIESGVARGGKFCTVYVSPSSVLWPMYMVSGLEHPSREERKRAHIHRSKKGLSSLVLYMWPLEGQTVEAGLFDPLINFVESSRPLLQGRLAVHRYANAVMFRRVTGSRMKPLANDIEDILNWLLDLMDVMEGAGLYDPESSLNPLDWGEE